MEKKLNTRKTLKSIEVLIAGLPCDDILNLNQMMYVRGGEGDPVGPITLPPDPPKK